VGGKDLRTPLLAAARSGHVNVCSFLASRGGDLQATGAVGNGLVVCAALSNVVEMLDWVLEQSDFGSPLLDEGNAHGATPLMYCVAYDKFEMVEHLLRLGRNASMLSLWQGHAKNAFECANSHQMLVQLEAHGMGEQQEMKERGIHYSNKFFESSNTHILEAEVALCTAAAAHAAALARVDEDVKQKVRLWQLEAKVEALQEELKAQRGKVEGLNKAAALEDELLRLSLDEGQRLALQQAFPSSSEDNPRRSSGTKRSWDEEEEKKDDSESDEETTVEGEEERRYSSETNFEGFFSDQDPTATAYRRELSLKPRGFRGRVSSKVTE